VLLRQVKWPINQVTQGTGIIACFRPTKLGNGLDWYWQCDCLGNSKQ